MNFFERVHALQRTYATVLCLGLDPRPAYFTAADRAAPNPLLAWGERLIRETADFICCVKPNSAFYEAYGVEGWVALRGTIAVAREIGIPVLLDAKRGDIGSTAEAYAHAAFHELGADAITLNPYLGRDAVDPFLAHEERGVFVLCHTSNPSADEFQTLDVYGRPLYETIAVQATSWHPHVGLVVGATYPQAIAAVRSAAPESWLLLPGVGTQGGDEKAALRVAGDRIIVPISRAIIAADNPKEAAQRLRDKLNRARDLATEQQAAETLPPRLQQLVEDLFRIGAVRFGSFTLASGSQSPIYIDLRLLASYPATLQQVARAYADILQRLTYNRLAALPYAALPIGTAVSLQTGDPLIYPRKEVKAYGRQRAIEGVWEAGEVAVILDDLITTGGSKVEAVQPLRDAGLQVRDVVVLLDRSPAQRSGDLAEAGLRLHAVLTLSQMLDHLARRHLITDDQRHEVEAYLAGS